MLRVGRVFRKLLVEGLLAAGFAFGGWLLWKDDEPGWALGFALGGAAVCALGWALQWRTGEVKLAWTCPRLSRLGLHSPGQEAPWGVFRTAEGALRALEQETAAFQSFFDGAHRDILATARRALELERLRRWAERALVDAPEGEAREALEARRVGAARELGELDALLGQLRARLVASAAPVPSGVDPAPLLHALEERTGALGAALKEVGGRS